MPAKLTPRMARMLALHCARGVGTRELAVRFGVTEACVRSYRTGRRHGWVRGQHWALTLEQEIACFEAWAVCEVGLYELAAWHGVTTQTMRNVLRRQAARAGQPF